MVNGRGAGVGEEVNRNVIRSFRALGTTRLQQIRRQGISDQRVALVNQILAERQGAAKVSEAELVKRLSEQRGVEAVKPSVTPTATERALGISLPADLRRRPVQEVLRQQTLIQTIRPLPPTPVIRPTVIPPEVKVPKIPKPRRQDPIARFFREELPESLRVTARDFIPNPQKREDIKRFISRFQNKGDQSIKSIEGVKVNIQEFFDPGQKIVRQTAERNLNTIQRQQEFLNKEVENFNKKFGDKQLTEKQFKESQIVSLALSSKQASLDAKTEEFNRRLNEFKEQGERVPTRFFTETLKGIATSPFTLAQFGIGASTRPIRTTQQAVQEIKKLPETIAQAPFTVTGQIAGTLIGTTATLSILKGLTSEANLLASRRKFITDRTIPKSSVKKTPLSETFKTEIEFKINDNQVKRFATQELNKKGIRFNTLSKVEQDFIVGQIKAKLINRPELFIAEARKLALQRLGVRNIKSAVKQRLQERGEILVRFDTQGRPLRGQRLSEIQRLSLQRLSQTLDKQRLRRASLERAEKPVESSFELLSKSQKEFFIEQLKARVRANPQLTLTKGQRIALENIRTQTQLKDIRTAILKGLEPKKLGDLLTLSQRGFIKSQIEAQLRSNPAKFLPKARLLTLKRLQQIQEGKAIQRAKDKGARNLKISDLMSKGDKEFIKTRIESILKTQPERFIPKSRQVALQLLKKPEPVKPVFKIVSSELTPVQRLLLKRLDQIGKVKVKPLVAKFEPKVIGIPKPPPIVKPKTAQRLRQELKQVNVQASLEITRLRQLQASKQRSATQLNARLEGLQKRRFAIPVFSSKGQQLLQQIQQVRQQLLQTQRTITATTFQSQQFSLSVKQISQQKVREIQRIAQRQLFEPLQVARPLVIPKKKKKKILEKVKVPFVRGKFTVFVRKNKKDIKFKSFSNKKIARKGLKKRLDETLRASGFIVNPKGRRIKPKITKGFRRSKIDPFRIVEVKRRRLDKKSEVREIIKARKIRSGKALQKKLSKVPKMRKK